MASKKPRKSKKPIVKPNVKRNLILVPLHNTGTHHAERIVGRAFDKTREVSSSRLYELRDADTGELVERVEL